MKTFALVLACALPLAAQNGTTDSDSAKAAAIVARHVTAVGGEAAIRSIKHIHMITTTSMANTEARRTRSETHVMAPNLLHMKMNMPGIGPMQIGFDGKIHWSISAIAGPSIHDDIPKGLTDGANFFAPPLDGLRISYAGRRKIGRRTYEAVRAVMGDGVGMTHYFDVETGFMAGMDPDDGPAPPPGRMSMTLEDYRRFGPILQPTRMTTIAHGQEIVVRTVSVSHKPFDAKIFDPPPAVRQLRDKSPR